MSSHEKKSSLSFTNCASSSQRLVSRSQMTVGCYCVLCYPLLRLEAADGREASYLAPLDVFVFKYILCVESRTRQEYVSA